MATQHAIGDAYQSFLPSYAIHVVILKSIFRTPALNSRRNIVYLCSASKQCSAKHQMLI